jgi:BirA family biotin operon repressor/biotin-[acetyl-CoA-carboxylase] ligase
LDLSSHVRAFQAAYRGPTSNVSFRQRVDSTNEVARRLVSAFLADEETPPRMLLIALEQTAGRGRLGRVWSSPRGQGLYASLVLPAVERDQLATLPMRAAVGLSRGVEELGARPCRVKWPNDLLVGKAKIGGILIETVARGDEPPIAIIGAGVNYGQPPEDVGERAVTSIQRESPQAAEFAVASATLVAALEKALEEGPPVAEYEARSAHRPGDVLVCRVGDKIVHGDFVGFDENGFLRLRGPAGERVLSSAEVIEG